MAEIGRTLRESLLESHPKIHKGKCSACRSSLDLYEIDFKKRRRIMRCNRCGMLHVYKKDIIGKWRLIKAQRPDLR